MSKQEVVLFKIRTEDNTEASWDEINTFSKEMSLGLIHISCVMILLAIENSIEIRWKNLNADSWHTVKKEDVV